MTQMRPILEYDIPKDLSSELPRLDVAVLVTPRTLRRNKEDILLDAGRFIFIFLVRFDSTPWDLEFVSHGSKPGSKAQVLLGRIVESADIEEDVQRDVIQPDTIPGQCRRPQTKGYIRIIRCLAGFEQHIDVLCIKVDEL